MALSVTSAALLGDIAALSSLLWCPQGGTVSPGWGRALGQLWGGTELDPEGSQERMETIMEQFNPSLRNFISMGKTYEKALASMTYAAKGYFDALVKMGELASESQGSKELGDVLFQMAEVHRQIQNQLEEMVSAHPGVPILVCQGLCRCKILLQALSTPHQPL
uniref:IMD domain-containing protein n=1 Tax=Malurus cyaneus samueli TaxID=2593467 RepID=A0A8C5X9S8_9PASS